MSAPGRSRSTAERYRSAVTSDVCSGSPLHFRQGFEQVGDEAVVGDLEDRCLLVLVDRDDDLRVLHAGQMLDRTGDAAGDVEIGCDHLAGLADLPVVRGVAGIDRGARCADGSAELVGNRQDDFLELFRRAERAAARDDDLGRGQFRAIRRRQCVGDEGRQAGVGSSRDVSTAAEPPSEAEANEAVRTVITRLASLVCTVWMALPA